MNNILKLDEIEGIDIELSNICNLKCPLCLSQLSKTKKIFVPSNVDIQKLIEKLNNFKNLKLVSIAGDASEPTLYPDLITLLDYLRSRNIFVELYTNGDTHNVEYWEKLNLHFNENSIIQFTICGSTQELHSKYRVNSNLNRIIENALAFKKNNKFKNDNMQYIKFEYNKNDNEKDILKILSQFSDYGFIYTDPVIERFFEKNPIDGICSEKIFQFLYRKKLVEVRKKKNRNINCYSLNKKYVRLDNFLNISPCICYRLNISSDFSNGKILDYSKILNNSYDFCFECDKDMRLFLEKHHRDAFYMC